MREQVTAGETRLKQIEEDLRLALSGIPNMSHPDAPVGTTAEDNKVINRWSEPRKFDFPAKDHIALAEGLNLVDFEAGSAVAGQKFEQAPDGGKLPPPGGLAVSFGGPEGEEATHGRLIHRVDRRNCTAAFEKFQELAQVLRVIAERVGRGAPLDVKMC